MPFRKLTQSNVGHCFNLRVVGTGVKKCGTVLHISGHLITLLAFHLEDKPSLFSTCHLVEETHVSKISAMFDPLIIITGEDWKLDGPVNSELHLLAQLLLYPHGPEQHPSYCWQGLHLSIRPLLHPAVTHEQYISAWGKNSSPVKQEAFHLYRYFEF